MLNGNIFRCIGLEKYVLNVATRKFKSIYVASICGS